MDDKKLDAHKSKLRSLGEEYIYALIDNPYECPIVIGPDGVIIFISRYSEKLLGIDGDDAIGKHVTEVVEGTHLHEILQRRQGQDRGYAAHCRASTTDLQDPA